MLAVSTMGNFFLGQKLEQVTERLFSREDRYQMLAWEFRLNVIQIQQWLTDISATRGLDGLDDGFDTAAKSFVAAQQNLVDLSTLAPEESADFDRMKTTLKAFYETGHKMAKLYVSGGPQMGNQFMSNFDAAAEAISKEVDGLTTRADSNKHEIAAVLQDTVTTSNQLVMGSSLFLVILLAGGMFALIRILSPLHGLRKAAELIAGNDLTADVPEVRGEHEIATLAQSFGFMKTNISKAITLINESSNNVNEASEDMRRIADDTHQTVSNQQTEIEQIAAAITEMTATVQEISCNTVAAADAAAKAENAVSNGHQVVDQTASATQSLAEEISRSSEVVANLRTDSEAIGGVLDVICGISEQTNLLALNAAIEAARAGEMGRGFAVVADEVRTLASRTQESTAEIQKMIERLQQGTEQASNAMEQSRSHAGATAELAHQAGQTFSEIQSAVNEIRVMSTQIASAAEEQGAVAEEINRNVTGIHKMSEHTAETARKTTDSSKVLHGQADRLQQVVKQFTLPA